MKIPSDKLLHLFVGYFIADVCLDINMDILFSVLIVSAVGIGKEIYDDFRKIGQPEITDYVATLLGGVSATLL